MKKIKNIFLILLIITYLGCNDSDDENDIGLASNGNLVALVGEQEFTFDTVGATYSGGYLSLIATRLNSDNLTELLSISVNNATESSFDLSDLSRNSATYTIGSDLYSSLIEDGSGELIITKLDVDNNLVSGTFKFRAVRLIPATNNTETISITSGSFTNIKLQ